MTDILNEDQIQSSVKSLALEIYNSNSNQLVFLGLGDNGSILAKRMANVLLKEFNITILVGTLDVTLYKSHDSKEHFITIGETSINFSLQGKTVVLISDQVNSGKTMIAGLNALSDYGEPLEIKCCCLIYRDCMTRPIYFHYKGKVIAKEAVPSLKISFYEKDGEDSIKEGINYERHV